MKSVYLPHLNQTVKMGRKGAPRKPRLSLSNYLASKGSLPTPPASVDYSPKAKKSLGKTYKNTELGCCVISGYAHVIGLTSANAGNEVLFSDDDIVQMYSQIGGYIPGWPDTDGGCNEQDALDYWLTKGDTRKNPLEGWLRINPVDLNECRTALYLFEHLYFGSGMPDEWLNGVKQGFVWDQGMSNPENGHCFIAFGYNQQMFGIGTWGILGNLTNGAMQHNIEELYVLLTDDMIDKARGKAPNGLDWAALVDDFNVLGGHVPVPQPPPPAPPAPPAPQPDTLRDEIDSAILSLEKLFSGNPTLVMVLQLLKLLVDQVV